MHNPKPLLLIVALCGCEAAPPEQQSETVAEDAPHWSYEGAAGPAIWAELSGAYATCGKGERQSPIEISDSGAVDEPLPAITFNYTSSPSSLGNTGHTLQAAYEAGSWIEIEGQRYDLLQLHFHHPSEHVIDGRHFPLEMHLVHRDSANRLAVVAVAIDSAAAGGNTALDALLSRPPSSQGVANEVELDAAALLPAARNYVTYEGSLTTPPCTEGVRWLVLTTPVQASAVSIDGFARLFPLNARPLQPLDGRLVRESSRAR